MATVKVTRSATIFNRRKGIDELRSVIK